MNIGILGYGNPGKGVECTTDLPKQTPEYAKYFNVLDSFDSHAKIPEHFAAVDQNPKTSKKIGWNNEFDNVIEYSQHLLLV